jgi:hypothetical protein
MAAVTVRRHRRSSPRAGRSDGLGCHRVGHPDPRTRSPLVAFRAVTITLHLSSDKHVHVIRAAWRINRRTFSLFWATGTFVAGYGGLSLAYSWPARYTLGSFLYVVTAWGLLLLALPSYTIWRYQRRLAKLRDEPSTVTINEERIYAVSQSANVDFAWTLVGSVLETRDSFVLRQGRMLRAVLPNSEFIGDDLAAFRRLLVSRRLA